MRVFKIKLGYFIRDSTSSTLTTLSLVLIKYSAISDIQVQNHSHQKKKKVQNRFISKKKKYRIVYSFNDTVNLSLSLVLLKPIFSQHRRCTTS